MTVATDLTITEQERDAIIQHMVLSDALALLEYLDKHSEELNVKKALFDHAGNRIEGDEDIEVECIPLSEGKEDQWYMRVKPLEGYEFIYLPVIPSVHVDFGKLQGSVNPSSKIFRFVSNPLSQFTKGGTPNVETNFTVVGYLPSTLLRRTR